MNNLDTTQPPMEPGSTRTNQNNVDDHMQQESNTKPVETTSASTTEEETASAAAAATSSSSPNHSTHKMTESSTLQSNVDGTSSSSSPIQNKSSNVDNTKTDNEKSSAVNVDGNDSMIDGTLTLENNDNEEEEELLGIASNEVKNIILQVISPYFDDEAGIVTNSVRPNSAQDNRRGNNLDNRGKSAVGGKNTTEEERVGNKPVNRGNNKGKRGSMDNMGGRESSDNNKSNNENDDLDRFDSDSYDNANDVDGDTEVGQHYDHNKSKEWITLICDGIMEKLIAMSKPYKFVVHTMIMRKNGAGMHVCSSCYYRQTDGWVSHAHDLSPHRYAVVTVYWSAI